MFFLNISRVHQNKQDNYVLKLNLKSCLRVNISSDIHHGLIDGEGKKRSLS